jgi:hypothetical protein
MRKLGNDVDDLLKKNHSKTEISFLEKNKQ